MENSTKEKAAKKTNTKKKAVQRKILTPAVLSKHHKAIKEAVKKVFSAREAAVFKARRAGSVKPGA